MDININTLLFNIHQVRCRMFQELRKEFMNVSSIKKYNLREKKFSTRYMIYSSVIIWGEFGFLTVGWVRKSLHAILNISIYLWCVSYARDQYPRCFKYIYICKDIKHKNLLNECKILLHIAVGLYSFLHKPCRIGIVFARWYVIILNM
jgi:hypothetical protein